MFLILTMAGRYQRFANEGFKTPKYLLPWGERTILAVILDELNKNKVFSGVLLIANHRDDAYMPHVRAVMKGHNIPLTNLVLTADTSGQVETAQIGLKALEKVYGKVDEAVVFHNIDTILMHRNIADIKKALSVYDGYIDIFGANNRGYSYVLIDDAKRVIEIAEKIVVSDLATSGLYGFRSPAIFKKYSTADDIYISSVFKRMIMDGLDVAVGEKYKESETIVLGTPDEYMNASLTLL